MSISIKTEINGIEKTIARLKNIEHNLSRQKLDKIIEQVAIDLQGWAWKDCPVDTGLLRGSITVEQVTDGYKIFVDDVYYGIWVHDGTRWMPPRPFLIGANSKKAKKELKDRLKRHIQEVK